MIELNTIYHEDCLDTIQRFEDGFIDLVVTSPPYNVDLGNNKHHKNPYADYDDNKPYNDYVDWLRTIFKALHPKMKSGGRIVINIGDASNGTVPTHCDISHFMREIGYGVMAHIVWDKNSIGSRTAWGSFQSPSSPSFPTPFEHIMVFYKDHKKLQYKGITDLEKQEFIDWSICLWKFNPENKQQKIGHNAMFPVELPKRCLKMFSWVDAVVYDPFMGAGTTAVACKKHGRKFVGSEISKEYVDIAKKRLSETTVDLDRLLECE